MILGKTLKLENVVYFEKASFSFDKNSGLVVVTASNKDSRVGDDYNNGAGKSSLFSAIPNLIYESTPLAEPTRSSKRDILSKASSISFEFVDNNGTDIKVVQNHNSWKIFVDGEDIKAHTLNIQRDKLRQYFPIDYQAFYTYVYIQSQRNLSFQVDKPADRLKYVTSLFDTPELYERMRKFFTIKYNDLKDKNTVVGVLEAKLLQVNSRLNALNLDDNSIAKGELSKLRLSELTSERDTLNKNKTQIEIQLNTLSVIESITTRINKLLKKNPELPNLNSKAVASTLELLRAYLSYERKLEDHKASVKTLIDRIEIKKQEVDGLDYASVEKKAKKLEKKIYKIKEYIHEQKVLTAQYEKLKASVQSISKSLKETGFTPKDLKNTDKEQLDASISVCSAILELEKLLSHKDCVCPTCQQGFNPKAVKSSIEQAKQQLATYTATKKALSLYNKYKEFSAQLQEHEEPDDVDQLNEQLTGFVAELKQVKQQLQKLEDLENLNERLASVTPPKQPEGQKPEVSETELETTLQMLSEYKSLIKTLNANEASKNLPSKAELDEEYEALQEKVSELESRLSKLVKKVSSFDLKFKEYQVLTAQQTSLLSEIQEVKTDVSHAPLIKSLEKAFGPRGVRVDRANEVVSLIESNLNKYAPLIFAEPFKFKMYCDDKGVFCNVDRGNKKVSDVRLLSGAESDCFRLLFAVSIMLLMPSSQRTNFMVLDEPDSHMGPRARSLFIDQFLPFLQSLVPHIFLITPLDHSLYPKHELWKVVKENSVSRLLKPRG